MLEKTTLMIRNTLLFAGLMLAACSGGDAKTVETPTKPVPQTQAPAPKNVAVSQVADPMERGAKLYKRCQTCHTLGAGEKHKVGPNLFGIYGLKAGSMEGFAYSKVMESSDIIWDDDTLSAYIENPRKFMPGNRMSFAGLRKPEDRKAVLDYMKAKTTP